MSDHDPINNGSLFRGSDGKVQGRKVAAIICFITGIGLLIVGTFQPPGVELQGRVHKEPVGEGDRHRPLPYGQLQKPVFSQEFVHGRLHGAKVGGNGLRNEAGLGHRAGILRQVGGR